MKKQLEKIIATAVDSAMKAVFDHLTGLAGGGEIKPAKKAKPDSKPAGGKKRGRKPMTPEQKAEAKAKREAAKAAAPSSAPDAPQG